MKISRVQLKEIIRSIVRERFDRYDTILEQVELSADDAKQEFLTEPSKLPIELQKKTVDVSEKYMNSTARWFSIENLFWELEPWFDDPMEVISYIYGKINTAARGDFDTAPHKAQKEKARMVYNKLFNLAQKARLLADNEEKNESQNQ